MNLRWSTIIAAAMVALVISPAAFACSFEKVDESEIQYSMPDGTEYTIHTDYYAWVNCGRSTPSEPYYDPNPPGGTYGPPAPPPPPQPPSTDACVICQDLCWGEYFACLSDGGDASWFGFCGILCRDGCRLAKDKCINGDCVESNQC